MMPPSCKARFDAETGGNEGTMLQQDATYVQLHPARNFARYAALAAQGGSFGRPAFFWENAIKTRGEAA